MISLIKRLFAQRMVGRNTPTTQSPTQSPTHTGRLVETPNIISFPPPEKDVPIEIGTEVKFPKKKLNSKGKKEEGRFYKVSGFQGEDCLLTPRNSEKPSRLISRKALQSMLNLQEKYK